MQAEAQSCSIHRRASLLRVDHALQCIAKQHIRSRSARDARAWQHLAAQASLKHVEVPQTAPGMCQLCAVGGSKVWRSSARLDMQHKTLRKQRARQRRLLCKKKLEQAECALKGGNAWNFSQAVKQLAPRKSMCMTSEATF